MNENANQSDIKPIIEPIDNDYINNETFKLWYANTFPYIETDFDAVTSYRLLQKVVKYLNQVISNNNQVIDNVNILNGNVDNLNQAFEQLQNYVNEYFDGIQVVKIEEISHVGLIHRYRITFYNDYSVEFETKDGEPNKLSVGNVEQGPEGSLPQVTITGDAPEQVINFIIPKGDTGNGIVEIKQIAHDFVGDRYISTYRMLFTDGNFFTYKVEDGKPNTLTIGNVTKGDNASATIRGQAPNQILDLVLPKGDRGPEGPQGPQGPQGTPYTLSVDEVDVLPAGSIPEVEIIGTGGHQSIRFGIPKGEQGEQGPQGNPGPYPTMKIGYVNTGLPSTPAEASITGVAPDYELNLTIPKGDSGESDSEVDLFIAESEDGDIIESNSNIELVDSIRNYKIIKFYLNMGGNQIVHTIIPKSADYNDALSIMYPNITISSTNAYVNFYCLNLSYIQTSSSYRYNVGFVGFIIPSISNSSISWTPTSSSGPIQIFKITGIHK